MFTIIAIIVYLFQMRRRRLSGKRVRGILMDLLRGCGDCYNPHASNSSKDCSHKKEVSHLTSCSPQIRISPCASPEPSCSNPGPSNGRYAFTWFPRIFFPIYMQCLRSDAMCTAKCIDVFGMLIRYEQISLCINTGELCLLTYAYLVGKRYVLP